MPKRIQLSRKRGFKLHEASTNPNGVVIVDRRTHYGNPYSVEEMEWNTAIEPTHAGYVVFYHGELCSTLFPTKEAATVKAVELHRARLIEYLEEVPDFLEPLRGKDLACWCGENSPCHALALLEFANA